ncbi:hypothetical protein [Caulobacter sp. 17J80-11]|uniref:hypothetical protein n=1 Tax=Caulobacter sp. 17J80-11 TaxID=2763502 RepID=UPI0016535225|nr:hypothetical protein [Caulobacter sp. 17J80-11]MBC6982279.1 hypothetical protein [Caulobacter sp. 17J80-11]
MFESLLLALLAPAAATPAFTPTPDCPRQEVCRFVPAFSVRDHGREVTVKADVWGSYVGREGLLSLFPGDIVLVRLEADAAGRLTPVFVRADKPDADAPTREADAAEQVAQAGDAALEGAVGFSTRGREVEPDLLRFSFKQMPGKDDMLLVVENGYGRRLDYRALMTTTEGRAHVTSVCEVPAGLLSFEHWPHAIVTLELTDFRLVPAEPGFHPNELPCD